VKKALRRLRLSEGDIVVVRDHETMQALSEQLPIKGVPNCPVIYVPGSVHRLSKEYLKKLMERAA
jgi:DNA-binding transcriptional regulator LsrR (DeoR family)